MKLRKQNIALVLLPLLLVSCGDSTSNNETKLPNSGTVVTADIGKTQLKKAFASTANLDENNDAIGLKVSGAHLETAVETNVSYSGITVGKIAASFKLTNGTFNVGVKGMTGDKAADFKAYAGASVNVNGNLSITSNTPDSTGTMQESTTTRNYDGTYSVSASIDNSTLYADLSNKEVFSLANTFLSTQMITLPTSGKIKTALDMKDSDFPLITSSDTEELDKAYQEFYQSLPEGGTYKDHGNDVYSYSGTVTGEELNKYLGDDTSVSDSLSADLSFDAASSYDYALIFNDKGFESFGIECTAKLNVTSNLSSNTLDSSSDDVTVPLSYSATGSVEAKFGVKIELVTGNDVSFPTINDADYTVISSNVD